MVDDRERMRSSGGSYLACRFYFLLLTIIIVVVQATPSSRHHINVCHFLPTDDELDDIVAQQTDEEDATEYSHKVITIKKYAPREHILISIIENETDEPQEYLYLAQSILPSGKPVGHFKSFDEYLPMRKCHNKEVFYNDEAAEVPNGERLRGGVTFEWVAPNTKSRGAVTSVTVIVTKVNMDLLHRHQNQHVEEEEETSGQ